jgi:hypothetical protein
MKGQWIGRTFGGQVGQIIVNVDDRGDYFSGIAFTLPKPEMREGDWPTKKKKDVLDEFFKETWSDPARPFKDISQRSQILLILGEIVKPVHPFYRYISKESF